MSVAAVAHFMLPDSPYAMWVRDELAGLPATCRRTARVLRSSEER